MVIGDIDAGIVFRSPQVFQSKIPIPISVQSSEKSDRPDATSIATFDFFKCLQQQFRGFPCKPLIVTTRWNYRGQERRGLVGSALPGGFNYLVAFPSIDLSFEYQITKRLSIFGSSRNALNTPRLYQRWNAVTPDYSRYYRSSPVGVQNAIGIKGTF